MDQHTQINFTSNGHAKLHQENDKLQTNLSHIKSAIVETYDSISLSMAKDTFDDLKERRQEMTPSGHKQSHALGTSNTFHHQPNTAISQLSNYKHEQYNYTSVSPTRSAMGLAPINHSQRFEAILKDRQYEQEQLYKLKKEFRAKE